MHTAQSCSLALALVLCSGCADGSDSSSTTRAPSKATSGSSSGTSGLATPTTGAKLSCKQRTAWLGQELQAAANTELAALSPQAGVSLPQMRSGQPVAGPGRIPSIDATGLVVYAHNPMGTGASAASELRHYVAHELEMRRIADREEGTARAPVAVYFMADRRASAKLLTTLAKEFRDGAPVRLALLDPTVERAPLPHLEHPSVKAYQALVPDKLAPGERATLLATHLRKALSACAPVIRVFGKVAGMDADRKPRIFADSLPAAVRSCDCKVGDLELFEHLIISIMQVHNPYRWLPLSFTPNAKQQVRLPRGATVAQLADALSSMSPAQLAAPISISIAH